jgi:uncharacterized protein YjbI with pentapeptide repeats
MNRIVGQVLGLAEVARVSPGPFSVAFVIAIALGILIAKSITLLYLSIWFVFALILASIVIFLGLWLIPKIQVKHFTDEPQKRFELENEARKTIAQIIGGAAILFGVYTALQTSQLTEISREGAITDRFTHALEQLGNDKTETRLGAIYALERVAKESHSSHWSVMQTLTGFIQERAHWSESGSADPPGPARDIQAALDVLGRRCGYPSQVPAPNDLIGCLQPIQESPEQVLNLDYTDLRQKELRNRHLEFAHLIGANLEKAYLAEIHLERALLYGAHLEGAALGRAHLEGAELVGAHLERADLRGAHLEPAYLRKAQPEPAHLEGADLRGAHLEGADLEGADLKGADLEGADLEGADLGGTHLEKAYLEGADLKGANLRSARLEKAYLEGADLEGVDLEGAHLEKAHLERANLKGAHLNGAHLKGAYLKWADLEKTDLEGADLDHTSPSY